MFKKIKDRFVYTMANFADDFIQAIRDTGYADGVKWHPEDEKILLENGAFISLSNIYIEQKKKTKEERAVWFNDTVVSLVTVPTFDTWGDVKSRLLPRIREISTFHIWSLHTQCEGLDKRWCEGIDYWAVGETLAFELVADMATTIQSTKVDDFYEWGVSPETAKAVAMENLYALDDLPWREYISGLWISPWNDNHDNARIFKVDTIMALPITGSPVIFIPNRDNTIIIDSDNNEAMAKGISMAEELADDQRYVSSRAFTIVDGQIGIYKPLEISSWFDQISLCNIKAEMKDYEDQKVYLEKILEKEGVDVFVATYSAIQKESGSVYSYCTWTETVDSYFPRTNFVALNRYKEESDEFESLGFVVWEELESECGYRINKLDGYVPVRRISTELSPKASN